jgi:thiamine biosynthesis protein ThiS
MIQFGRIGTTVLEVKVIDIWVNGEKKNVSKGLSVQGLLRELEVPEEVVIVERNRKIVSKKQYDMEVVEPGDKLELVRLMGGG